MSSSGPNAPGAMATEANGTSVDWSTPDEAKTSNNTYAYCVQPFSSRVSYYLNATTFGFAVPAGSTIDGIVVEIERKAKYNSTYHYVDDGTVQLLVGGSRSGDNKAATAVKWPTSDAVVDYGSASDLWGLTPTVDEVNASDFGVSIAAVIRSEIGKGHTNNTAYVDFISITVYYTEGGGGGVSIPVVRHHLRQQGIS